MKKEEPLGMFRMGTMGRQKSKKEKQMDHGYMKIMHFIQRGIDHDPLKRSR